MPEKKTQSKKVVRAKKTKTSKSRPGRKSNKEKQSRKKGRVTGKKLNLSFGVDMDAVNTAIKLKKNIVETDMRKVRAAAKRHIHRLTLDKMTGQLSNGDRFLFAYSCEISDAVLPGYSSLDERHVTDIESLISNIKSYADDATQLRPRNFLMLASPGSGKSHFIDSIAKRLESRDVIAINFNMASMSGSDDLIRPLDEARNAKVEDKLPLLFLDEFDSSASYYGLLLPLLWDGALSLGRRDLKLGKIVIVLAGSHPLLPDTLTSARSMASEIPVPEGMPPKLIDLLSRINGSVISIPPFYAPAMNIDRRTDKVAIACKLLKRRFGDKLYMVPLALLRLIADMDFRYGVRSIAHMIDLIPYKKPIEALTLAQLALPLGSPKILRNSSLANHVINDEDQAHGIIEAWKTASKCSELVPISSNVSLEKIRGQEEIADFFLELDIAFELQRISLISNKKSKRIKKKQTTDSERGRKKATRVTKRGS